MINFIQSESLEKKKAWVSIFDTNHTSHLKSAKNLYCFFIHESVNLLY